MERPRASGLRRGAHPHRQAQRVEQIGASMTKPLSFPPRLIRFRQASAYLGMDRNRFNREVRPNVHEIPIGDRGIAFDRVELDAWADAYCERNGRPARITEGRQWVDGERQDSIEGNGPTAQSNGISTSASKGSAAFARALELTMKRKPSGTSRGGSSR